MKRRTVLKSIFAFLASPLTGGTVSYTIFRYRGRRIVLPSTTSAEEAIRRMYGGKTLAECLRNYNPAEWVVPTQEARLA